MNQEIYNVIEKKIKEAMADDPSKDFVCDTYLQCLHHSHWVIGVILTDTRQFDHILQQWLTIDKQLHDILFDTGPGVDQFLAITHYSRTTQDVHFYNGSCIRMIKGVNSARGVTFNSVHTYAPKLKHANDLDYELARVIMPSLHAAQGNLRIY